MDQASAAKTTDSGSIPYWLKPKTSENAITIVKSQTVMEGWVKWFENLSASLERIVQRIHTT